MSPVASFHLVSERRGRQALVIARLGLDHRQLDSVDGLRFVRTLGTGRGTNTGPSIDARRSAMFAVWDDEENLDRFLSDHPIAHRWRRADEAWHVRLHLRQGHGRWGDFDVRSMSSGGSAGDGGPVAVLTRATIRPGATLAFVRASRSFGRAAEQAPGALAVVGIGERPIGRLGTFSLWESTAAAREFARGHQSHRESMESARAGAWFAEELFATFTPSESSGTWNGRDPLTKEA